MLVKKEIIRPGTYWYTDQQTGLPRRLVVTAEGVRHLLQTGNQMLAAGLSIPVPVEHQPDARPLTAAERAAKALLNNGGWVRSYETGEVREKDGTVVKDVLFGLLDIPDPALAKKLPHTIRWTSPWINSFTDGDGRQWHGVISHVALTSRPRITRQQPFGSVAAAMALVSNLAEAGLDAAGQGIVLSRAGLLLGDGQSLKPAYPLAFSLWAGAQLADNEIKEKKAPPKKEGGEGKPGGGEGGKPPAAAKGDGEGEGGGRDGTPPEPTPTPDGAAPQQVGPDGMPVEEALIDQDGDISVYAVLADLFETIGVPLEPGTNADNFCERAYKALMEKMKMGAANGQQTPGATMNTDPKNMTNQPPGGGTRNELPPNPVIQQQPPLYMALSLEQVSAMTDPTMKQMASVMLSLQNNAFEQAKRERTARIERLCRKVGQQHFTDQLLAQAASATLSLGADGRVADSMAAALDLLEAGVRDLPALLTTPSALLSEHGHPKEYAGGQTNERAAQVADELCKNTGLPARQSA